MWIYSEDLCSVLNCHNVVMDAEFYSSMQHLLVIQGFQKELYNDIQNVALWRVLRKRLNLEVYKLSIDEHLERWIVLHAFKYKISITLATQ
jgi:hypothetical protein